jgi:DNA processing protein
MSERPYWAAFNLIKGMGPTHTRQLLAYFGSLQAAWSASAPELTAAGIDQRARASLIKGRARLDPQAELQRLDKLGIAMLTWDDPDYPPLLAELRPLDFAPPVLYLRGTLMDQDQRALAIVGARSVTAYGRQVTHTLAQELAAAGLTIVSGLARGVDSEAHQAALEAGGRTIAVLPCGPESVYPPEHRRLAARIIQQGALITPLPPGTQPTDRVFQPRNRALSGLAQGVLVIEAGDKSGALMTAGYALEQGREVFAVPGNITAQSSNGTNRLIQDGAHPVTSSRDVLEILKVDQQEAFASTRQILPDLSAEEQQVYQLLTAGPAHIDEITRHSTLTVSQVSAALSLLEIKGMARNLGGMQYARR